MVVTDTWGGTISGYCATGMLNSVATPAMVVTIAMTIASRGRSTKTADSMVSVPAERLRHGRRPHRRAVAHGLQPFDDDLLAARQALLDHYVGAVLAAGLESLHHGRAILDDEDVDALLVGDQRRLRHHYFFLGRSALEHDAYQLAVDELE